MMIPKRTVMRQATPEDFDGVRTLLVNANLTSESFFTEKRFLYTLRDFGKYNLVAVKDGKVVGYIFGCEDVRGTGRPEISGYMGRLVVDPDYRRQGIGRSLAKICSNELIKSGYTIIFAEARRDNAAAKNILKEVGFADNGDSKYILSIDKNPK